MNVLEAGFDGAGKRFAIVVSRFNEAVTGRLLAGARDCLVRHGVEEDSIDVAWVPGAWELTPVVQRIAQQNRHAAIVALGCVIRGETSHYDYVAGHTASGLADLALKATMPVLFGVLTTEDEDQAMARAGGEHGNKGWDAALGALEMANLYDRLGRRS